MTGKIKAIIKKAILLIAIFAILGFFLNWFLAYKLESYLRNRLSDLVSNASGGFYHLDFEELDIALLNGELKLKGIKFSPDTTTFRQWAERDSLPRVYANVTVESVYFKGINLIWRWSYKNLDFNLFEIKRPIIDIYDSSNSDRLQSKTKNNSDQRVYDLISPYIDILTVNKMNLENASITYVALDEGTPSVYSLKNVSFHAYGFRLDKDSYMSGKLLYCDDFEFVTNQPQALLTNNQMILNTDKINLNTRDSIIRIESIELVPQKTLWAKYNQIPPSYLEASVGLVQINGLQFKRKDACSYLEARSFDISTSDFKYYNMKQDSVAVKSDSISPLSWTLYALVSPIFKSIAVDQIGINDAKLAYSSNSTDGTDVYKLDKFNFTAFNFQVDSLADKQKRFLYSEGFDVNAEKIDATMSTKNHVFRIEKMHLNTLDGDFNIKEIHLWPLTTKTDLDYMQGSIDSIGVAGIIYDKGLKVKELTIETPRVEYVKMPVKPKSKKIVIQPDSASESSSAISTIDLITPSFGFLSIDKINLNNGNITFNDRRSKDNMIYKLPKIDFYATKAIVNEQTIQNSDSYFLYDNFKFKFQDFDNLLPGKDYRLIIKRGEYTGIKGDLELQGISLIPQEKTWRKSPDTYIGFNIPLLTVKDVYYKFNGSRPEFKFNSFDIKSPVVDIVKVRHNERNRTKPQDFQSFSFAANVININEARIRLRDLTKKDSTHIQIQKLGIESIALTSGDNMSIENIVLHNPVIQIRKNAKNVHQASFQQNYSSSFVRNIIINNFEVRDLSIGIQEPLMNLHSKTNLINIKGLDWNKSKLDVNDIEIAKPIIKIRQWVNSTEIDTTNTNKKSNKRIYENLAAISESISIGRLNMFDAEIDYSNVLNGKSIQEQQVNSTNFDFTGLKLDNTKGTVYTDDFNFSTMNLRFPLDNGFYTFKIGEVDVHQRDTMLKLKDLHLIPSYPKEEFAYQHPRHKDWFDVKVDDITLSGIDYSQYFTNKIFDVRDVQINDVKLLNYKNQQIEIQHNIMPMIYEGLQKAPLNLNIDNLDVHNFMVVYEELPKKGDVPGKIFFTDMNGQFTGLTNVVTRPNQYIRLRADGKFMGTGRVDAIWLLPVSVDNDNFLLNAQLRDFELKELNQLIEPLAKAKVNTGRVDSLLIKTEASSKGAIVQMRFIYNGLSFTVLRERDGETTPNRFVTTIVNSLIKKDNPDRRRRFPRELLLQIERNPYHSTFNYLWQILQPPVAESVGVSQKKQNFFKGLAGFVSKIKNFFSKDDKLDKQEDTAN